MNSMRVLMVSRPCMVEIAQFPDVELMVLVPSSWREGGHVLHLERTFTTGYELVSEPVVFDGSFHVHFYPRLARRLRAFAPDVVHIDEEPYNLATFQVMWLAKRAGARTVWFSWQNLKRRYPPPFRFFERYNLRHADYAIVGSEGAARVWREKGYDGPAAVIPQFGVAPEIFAPQAREQSAGGDFVVGYAGRLVPEKGCDLLLEAMAGLDGAWRLVMLGAGPERECLEALAHRLEVADRVSFSDWIPALQLPAFYRTLDAFVLPSRSRPNWVEQFGRVLIEAMACGVPVVGSDCGEIPYVIGDAGLIFAEDDIAGLRECLVRLARDANLRAGLAQSGRERVLARFTQARVAAQTVEVYRELIGRGD